MGQQSRYKVPMFDTTYRVVTEAGGKSETIYGSNSFPAAVAQYDEVAAAAKDSVVYLMHRARILKRSDQ